MTRDELLSMTQPGREETLMRSPVLITGLVEAWSSLQEWPSPEKFTSRFGRHRIFAWRHWFGRDRLGAAGILDGGANFTKATIPLSEVIPHAGTGAGIMLLDGMKDAYQ